VIFLRGALRRGAVLDWRNIDLDRRHVNFNNTKTEIAEAQLYAQELLRY